MTTEGVGETGVRASPVLHSARSVSGDPEGRTRFPNLAAANTFAAGLRSRTSRRRPRYVSRKIRIEAPRVAPRRSGLRCLGFLGFLRLEPCVARAPVLRPGHSLFGLAGG